MQKDNRIKKQTFMQGVIALMLSQIVIKVFGLVYKLYLTNKEGFGDAGNAIYSSGYQIYALLLTLSSIGVPSAISKLVSERVAIGDNKGAHRIFKISFVTFALIGLAGTLVLFFGAKYIANIILEIPEAEYTLMALSPSIFFVAITSVIRGYFNGMEDMKASANSQSLEQIFKTGLTIIVVEVVAMISSANTVLMAAGANLATTFATFFSFAYVYAYYKYRRKSIAQTIKSSSEISKTLKTERVITIIKQIMWVAIPIALSSLLSAINKNIDSMTVVRSLKNFLPEAEAKIQYGILGGKVDTLTSLPLSFNIAFATALVPAMASAFAKGDKETAKKKVNFSLLITILIGLPCTIGMCVLAGPILNLLFPKANSGTTILQISSFTIIFTVLAQTINGALQGIGKVKVPAIALGTGVLAKLVLNIILIPIPEIGANGAAIASVVCHIISFTIGYSVLRRNIKIDVHIVKNVIKPIIATAIMGIITYFSYIVLCGIVSERIATIISLIIAIVIYAFTVLILKIFTKDEILMIPKGNKIYNFLIKLRLY